MFEIRSKSVCAFQGSLFGIKKKKNSEHLEQMNH